MPSTLIAPGSTLDGKLSEFEFCGLPFLNFRFLVGAERLFLEAIAGEEEVGALGARSLDGAPSFSVLRFVLLPRSGIVD